MKVGLITEKDWPAAGAVQELLPGGDRALVCELMAPGGGRYLLAAMTDAGELAGYAVFGLGELEGAPGLLIVYAGRAMPAAGFLGRAALVGLLGAAEVTGRPIRVHTAKVEAFARAMGAKVSFAARDGDGLPQGVFYGV